MNTQEKIIQQIEELIVRLKNEIGTKNPDTSRNKGKIDKMINFSGLTGEIFDLLQEGFFDNAKSLSEIQIKLKENGVNKPTSALMKPILLLIRKKIIARSKPEKGSYQYYKRLK